VQQADHDVRSRGTRWRHQAPGASPQQFLGRRAGVRFVREYTTRPIHSLMAMLSRPRFPAKDQDSPPISAARPYPSRQERSLLRGAARLHLCTHGRADRGLARLAGPGNCAAILSHLSRQADRSGALARHGEATGQGRRGPGRPRSVRGARFLGALDAAWGLRRISCGAALIPPPSCARAAGPRSTCFHATLLMRSITCGSEGARRSSYEPALSPPWSCSGHES